MHARIQLQKICRSIRTQYVRSYVEVPRHVKYYICAEMDRRYLSIFQLNFLSYDTDSLPRNAIICRDLVC